MKERDNFPNIQLRGEKTFPNDKTEFHRIFHKMFQLGFLNNIT